MLFLTIDANFRLKNKARGIKNDPPLGDGWAHWVPETPYQDYISEYGYQTEVARFVKSDNMVSDLIFCSQTYVIRNFMRLTMQTQDSRKGMFRRVLVEFYVVTPSCGKTEWGIYRRANGISFYSSTGVSLLINCPQLRKHGFYRSIHTDRHVNLAPDYVFLRHCLPMVPKPSQENIPVPRVHAITNCQASDPEICYPKVSYIWTWP